VATETKSLFLRTSIRELGRRLAAGSLTPLDLAEETIRRISLDNPRYKAFVSHEAEVLRRGARAAAERLKRGEPVRLLEAVPVGVKDIMNTADYPTQMGSPLWKGFTPGNDARVVFNLARRGALVAGKTVTAEFAVHALNETENPHDPARTPGTSSSGSAVAVAAGMVPLAIGTQTAGSIVRPASFCGVYGCKPSFGLIPRTGILKTTDTLDTVGFFTAHQEDMVPAFDSLRVHGQDYPLSNAALSDRERQGAPAGRPWRVALVKTHTWEYAPEYAHSALARFAEKAAALPGIEIIETSLPEEMNTAHKAHAEIYNKLLAYYFQGEYQRAELVSPSMRRLIEEGFKIEPKTFLDALEAQRRMCAAMDEFFSRYDIILSLATAGEAPLRTEEEAPDPALMWTMTHLPVVCAPVFRSPAGLPFGLQIVARRYDDYKLFRFVDLLATERGSSL
jgi:Asp-tRNA(Asn)/Glu-tRNA(Gln) amidotransferase A subunit family amidase